MQFDGWYYIVVSYSLHVNILHIKQIHFQQDMVAMDTPADFVYPIGLLCQREANHIIVAWPENDKTTYTNSSRYRSQERLYAYKYNQNTRFCKENLHVCSNMIVS